MSKIFSSSTFFPVSNKIDKNALSPMIQSIESGLPVFSKDVNAQGAKSFFSCGYLFFVKKYYRNMKDKHVYELIQHEKPTRIYVDMDAKGVLPVDFEREIKDFTNVMKALIKEHFSISDPTIHILDASTDQKCSAHIVVDVFLQNVASVKGFIETCLHRRPCEYVDDSVYSRNRSFRLLYSRKFGSTEESTLKYSGSNKYDEKLVLDTLIQAFIPPHINGMEASKGPHYFTPSKTFTRHKCSSGTLVTNVPKPMYSFLNSLEADLVSMKQTDTFITCIVANVTCPWAKRKHKSNNHFLTINKNSWKAWFQCSDPDCSDCPFHSFDALWMFQDWQMNSTSKQK